MTPSADLKARLLAEVKEAPAPTRAQQQRLAWGIVLVVSILVGGQFFISGGIEIGTRPLGFVVGVGAAWALAILALVLGLRSRGQLGPPAIVLWGLTIGSLVVPFGVGVVLNGVFPSTAAPAPGHPGLICLELSLAWSTVPLTAWVFVRRDSDPVHPVAHGAAVGALAGCLSAFLVNLKCGFTDPTHIALGHLLPAALQTGVGALMGSLVMSVRTRHAPLRTGATIGGALGGWLATLVNTSIQHECPTQLQLRQVLWLAGGIAVGGLAGAWLGSRAKLSGPSASPGRGPPHP